MSIPLISEALAREWREAAIKCGMTRADLLRAAIRRFVASIGLSPAEQEARDIVSRQASKRFREYQESLPSEEKSKRGSKAVQARWAKKKVRHD